MKDTTGSSKLDPFDYDVHNDIDIDKVKRILKLRRNMQKDVHMYLDQDQLNHNPLQDDRYIQGNGPELADNIGIKSDDKPQHDLEININGVNIKESETCRNSVQGKVLIADDAGHVCQRRDVNPGGCCNDKGVSTKLFSCETCLDNGCCAIYEYCISCCMEPEKKPLLQKFISGKSNEPSPGSEGSNFNVLFSSITDHFEFCLTKCRTNSLSVQHENSYRDPRAKHCYGESPPSVLAGVPPSSSSHRIKARSIAYDQN